MRDGGTHFPGPHKDNIEYEACSCYTAKATVGDLFGSPTVGDLTFFFGKIDVNHWKMKFHDS